MGVELLTFLGLLLVFEGIAYALFPRAYHRAIAEMARWPQGRIRFAGLVAAIASTAVLAWVSAGRPEALGFDEIRTFLATRVAG